MVKVTERQICIPHHKDISNNQRYPKVECTTLGSSGFIIIRSVSEEIKCQPVDQTIEGDFALFRRLKEVT